MIVFDIGYYRDVGPQAEKHIVVFIRLDDEVLATARDMTSYHAKEDALRVKVKPEKADYTEWLTYDFPPELAASGFRIAQRYRGQRQKWFVFRFLGTDRDIEIVRHLRQHTDAIFRVDANCGWSAETAIRAAQELRDSRVDLVEQPTPDVIPVLDQVRADADELRRAMLSD